MRSVRTAARSAAALAVITVVAAGCGGQEAEPKEAASPTVLETNGKQLLDVPAGQAPTVKMRVKEDSESGWNLHLTTERFEFTPGEAGGRNEPGGGHAHLYLDGDKIARIYGEWFHLGAGSVPEGPHTLTVQLNANDHTPWATGGKPIEAKAEITSTGEKGDGHQGHDHEHSMPNASPSDS